MKLLDERLVHSYYSLILRLYHIHYLCMFVQINERCTVIFIMQSYSSLEHPVIGKIGILNTDTIGLGRMTIIKAHANVR